MLRATRCMVLLFITVSQKFETVAQFAEQDVDIVNYLHLHFGVRTCYPYFNNWIYNHRYVNEKDVFLSSEKSFQATCQSERRFILSGNYSMPKLCDTLLICNTTYCLSIPKEANKFSFEFSAYCANTENVTTLTNILKYHAQPEFLEFTIFQYYDSIARSDMRFNVKYLAQSRRDINFDANFAHRVDEEYNHICEKDSQQELYVEGVGELPTECEDFIICNKEDCTSYSKTSMSYAFIFRRNDETNNLNLPFNCHARDIKNIAKRAALEMQQLTTRLNSTFGIARFNLPGYKYCGPGTEVEKMDDLGGPTNELDNLCRQHDTDYLLGVPAEEADSKFLQGIFELHHPLYPFFYTVFQAKHYFERVFGKSYTSSLYYFPENQQSLTMFFSQSSDYDHMTSDKAAFQKGKTLEQKWKRMLREIWAGYCLSQSMPWQMGKDNHGQASPNVPQATSSKNTQGGTTVQSKEQTGNVQLHDQASRGDVSVSTDEADYPAMSTKNPCRVLISEISSKHGLAPSFLELERRFPANVQLGRMAKLSGYLLIVVRVGDPSSIVLTANLDKRRMRIVKESNPATKRLKEHAYFVVGSVHARPDVDIQEVDMVVDSDDIRGFPQEEASTYAVILLHMPSLLELGYADSTLSLGRRDGLYISAPVGDEQRFYIQKYVQDVILYGAPCSLVECEEFLQLIPGRGVVESVNELFIPIPYILEQKQEPPFLSINRCSQNSLPMQLDDFVEGNASPGSRNSCPTKPPPSSFDMYHLRLQSSAQKVVVNTHNFFSVYYANPVQLEGTPLQLTSQVTSVSESIIRKVLNNWRKNSIETPGKKRNRPFPTLCKIDSFNADLIRRTIQDIYKENRPPFVAEIFRRFLEGVSHHENQQRAAGNEVDPFVCHEKTFRKILHRLGFKFGKIQMRDALLMRPEIVKWRGMYLKEMRSNRNNPTPMEVVWLDQTWIDPHARTGKAWVPVRETNYRERAKYSYHKNKVGRGGRIIVLNAGGVNGFVPGVMEVFPVKKKDVTGDYHDNVDSKFYISWFKNLLEQLDKTGKKYIIVQDNAPYHGASDIPKSGDTKKIMYEWLLDNLPLAHRSAFLDEKSYLKWELWEMVKEQKKTRNFYVIDRMAEEHGHRVLRLPPYNCDLSPIEPVWKDVKYEVKTRNINQNVMTITEVAKEVMQNYPAEKWKRHVEHILKLEEDYWVADGCFDTYMENNFSLVIPVNEDDDTDDDDDLEYQAIPTNPVISTSSVHDNLNDDDDDLLDI